MKINLQLKGALKTVALLFLLLAFLWVYVGLRVGVWGPLGYVHYVQCILGIQPLGYYLWHGEIKQGASLSELTERFRPSSTLHYGEWTELQFTPGCRRTDGRISFGEQIVLLARGDSLVRASYGSCTFIREFFNGMTPADESARQKDFKAYMDQKKEMKAAQAQPPGGGAVRSPSKLNMDSSCPPPNHLLPCIAA